jgi:hypothetical protein
MFASIDRDSAISMAANRYKFSLSHWSTTWGTCEKNSYFAVRIIEERSHNLMVALVGIV